MPKKRLPRKAAAGTETGPVHAFDPVAAELIEVLDENARPLLLMPRAAALAQRLSHQAVLAVARNREGQIYLHRRSERKKSYPGLWSVSASGLVKAGEALEEAALRKLDEEIGVSGLSLTHVTTAAPSAATGWGRISLFLSSPANILINPDPEDISVGMFVDEDELAALMRDMPEMLTPALKWAAGVTDLFKF